MERVRNMRPTDPCVCGSRKDWSKCCGSQLKDKTAFAAHVSVTGETAVRFFLGNLLTNEAYTAEDGNVLVFTSRAPALAINESLNHAFQVVGMGAAKWAQFQKDVPQHLVISDALA